MKQYGIIGNPVEHSLSPLLHKLIYAQTGYRAEYSRFLVESARVGEVTGAMRTLGLAGINVTSPHKQAILPYMTELSPAAVEIGAVNTVLLRDDGTTYGDNTDAYGFAQSLEHRGVAIAGKRFVLCGQSGAGAAVRYALLQHGAAEVLTASTNPAKGIPYAELPSMEPRDVIVNCTPLGMEPRLGESVVGPEVLSRFSVAVDLIYNPTQTRFLALAEKEGLATLNGLWMLIFQGIRSFELWAGKAFPEIDPDSIYKVLEAEL